MLPSATKSKNWLKVWRLEVFSNTSVHLGCWNATPLKFHSGNTGAVGGARVGGEPGERGERWQHWGRLVGALGGVDLAILSDTDVKFSRGEWVRKWNLRSLPKIPNFRPRHGFACCLYQILKFKGRDPEGKFAKSCQVMDVFLWKYHYK